MKVICAGFSKTGTKSMASALRILGYSVYDTIEHWTFHADEYIKALESDEMPDFASMYANVDAVTDIPAFYYFQEIFQAFPSAKVVLMMRDDEDMWLASLLKTLEVWRLTASKMWVVFGFFLTPTGRKLKRLLDSQGHKILKSSNSNDSDLNENYKRAYREHNVRVRSAIPPHNLLVYNVKEGWKPLCEFLGVEVPAVPFPRSNANSLEVPGMLISSRIGRRIYNELVFIVTVLVIGLAMFTLIVSI